MSLSVCLVPGPVVTDENAWNRERDRDREMPKEETQQRTAAP